MLQLIKCPLFFEESFESKFVALRVLDKINLAVITILLRLNFCVLVDNWVFSTI
jgi:hypothetical protein